MGHKNVDKTGKICYNINTKYYSKGRDIMRNCKLSITIALGCFLITNPAKAFFPVFDFAEMPAGVITQVLTSAQNLSEIKSQLAEMTENLRAIGDVRQTITQFSKSLYKGKGSKTAEATMQAVEKAFAANTIAQDKAISAVNSINDAHKSIIDSMVSQIEQETKISSAETSNYIQLAQNDLSLPIVEEEEEETADINKEKENLQKYFDDVKKQNLDLYVKMNDLFESSISVMNESADLNHQAFLTLNNVIKDSGEEINATDRQQLEERTTALLNKDQENSDFGISLMEDIQANYSKQYHEKIADSINNYQKMVQAYIDGHITAQELKDAGNALKAGAEVASVDGQIFAQYNQENGRVQAETSKLVADVKKAWADEGNNS